MSFERQWPAVPPQQLTADGGTLGQVQVASTLGFKVKARAVLVAPGQPNLLVEIKRVVSKTMMFVGTVGTPITSRNLDISRFTVAAGAYIYAEEQDKAKIPLDDKLYATYDQEPTVAWRTVMVDPTGDYYGTANPLPVRLSDGAISIGTVSAEINVALSAIAGAKGPNTPPDSVRIGDGTNQLRINPDGSLNFVASTSPSANKIKSVFNVASAVPAGVTTQLATYTVPASFLAVLQRISVSGENIAKFTVLINGVKFDVRRTYFSGGLNVEFDYTTGNTSGYTLNAGDVLTIQVVHSRPYVGDFEGRIQVQEVPV